MTRCMKWLLTENIPAFSLKIKISAIITLAHTKVFSKFFPKNVVKHSNKNRVFWIGRVRIKIFILN